MSTEIVTRIQVGGTAGTAPYDVLVGAGCSVSCPGCSGTAPSGSPLHPEALADR
jgi:3-dehydroquinate synthase